MQVRVESLPVAAELLKKETMKDRKLVKVLRYCRNGWPDRCPDDDMKPFFGKRHEMEIEDGILFWGIRAVIPESLQVRIIDELHMGHSGMVSMKSIARLHVWFPSIDQSIESKVRSCIGCQKQQSLPQEAPLHSLNWPEKPWTRIQIDYLGPFHNYFWLVLVDATTKWVEVFPVRNATARVTIDKLRESFARFGLPAQLLSDNGSQFCSEEFQQFLRANGIQHIRTAVGHPRTNGLSERMVRTVKTAIRAGVEDGSDPQLCLQNFLFRYRNTPHSTTGKTPAEMLLRCSPRTRLHLLRPDVASKVAEQQNRQKVYHDRSATLRTFQIGDRVLVRDFRDYNGKWAVGSIVRCTGPCSYKVQVGSLVWKRHVDHLRATSIPVADPELPEPVIALRATPEAETNEQQTGAPVEPAECSGRLSQPLTEITKPAKSTTQEQLPTRTLRDRTKLKKPSRFTPS